METTEILIANQHLKEVNPLVCGQQFCNFKHSFGPASRDYWLLHYVVSGKGCFTKKGRTHQVNASQCFVIRPYEITYYEADAKNPWHYIWIGFESGIELPDAFNQPVFNLPAGGQLFTSMLEASLMKTGREAFLCGKVWELIAAVSAIGSTYRKNSADYVEQAKNCIESEYMRGITVSSLAARLNLDRSYFSTLFKRYTQKSPQRYLNDFRMQKAAKLLTEHGYTPTMAALSTGYPDIFSFSKMFKRNFGVSPSMYIMKNFNQK